MRSAIVVGAVATVAAILTVPSPVTAATCESLASLVLSNVAVTQAVVVGAGQFSPTAYKVYARAYSTDQGPRR